MKSYRKRPIIIQAEQWFKVTYDEENSHSRDTKDTSIHYDHSYHLGIRFYRMPDIDEQLKCKYCGDFMNNHGWIDTLEGGHIVCPGDYIITGIKGEMYPCKPDIFNITYEEVME